MIKVVLFLYLSVFVHELGHFIAAKAMKIKILSASLFMYPIFYIYVRGTLVKIGFIPVTGYVNAPGIYQQSRIKKIIYFASGIAMNCILMAISKDLVLVSINTFLVLSNLMPFKKSDGRNILESL